MQNEMTRRSFVGKTVLSSAGLALAIDSRTQAQSQAPEFKRKIKLGVVGHGGRGGWIAQLFQKHGGFEMHAVADYFPEVADQCGQGLGVDKSRRFSTLSGYKRLMESGVEAVALETPSYFFPEHARAAVAAGLHVYMAKPVAVDAPGCLQILAAAQEATRKSWCFLVDYQIPTDPANQEVRKRLREPGFGPICEVASFGHGGGSPDPPKTTTIESRLRGYIWMNDVALGGDYIGNFDIHAIDAAIWVLGKRPVAAAGGSGVCRPDPHGDARGVCSVVYEYADGLVHNHSGLALPNFNSGELSCRIFGQTGTALINYSAKATLRSSDDHFEGTVDNLYDAGATRNIATFYRNITADLCQNEIVQRAVDGALTCILGREAAAGLKS
ncbi:MAG: Gfo/Idh/MocA family oxidoreductase [Verrucomicrobia bacterium]|nr:Gfo/Idh/MocA family oxidoreductase [Verrucomicrobiota bacterium]